MTEDFRPKEKQWVEDARKAMFDGLSGVLEDEDVPSDDVAAVAMSATVNVLIDLIISITESEPSELEYLTDLTMQRIVTGVNERRTDGPASRN